MSSHFYTYILKNSHLGRHYIGYTSDLKNRLRIHTKGRVKSTKFNNNYRLEWYCAFPYKKQAIDFEHYLKTGSGIAFMNKGFCKSKSVVVEKDIESVV